jgi:hypothetical protein
MDPYYATHRKDFGHATRVNLALGRQFTSRDYVLARRIRTESMCEWDRVLPGETPGPPWRGHPDRRHSAVGYQLKHHPIPVEARYSVGPP